LAKQRTLSVPSKLRVLETDFSSITIRE